MTILLLILLVVYVAGRLKINQTQSRGLMFDMKNPNRLKKRDDRLDLRLRRCRRSVCSARLVDGAARFYSDSHSLTCIVGRDRLI
jgi:hypothetical protein